MTNIREKLFIPCKKLSRHIPLEPADVSELLKLLPVDQITPRYSTIIELLRLKQVSLTRHRLDDRAQAEEKVRILGSVLIHLADYLDVNPPMKFLVKGKFERFEQHCLQSKDEEERQLPRKAKGIYPLSSEIYASPQSVFAKSSSEGSGNANWIHCRYVLSTWYELERAKRREWMQQVYNFLLSNREFLYSWSKDANKHLWATLYLYYNKLLLNLNLITSQTKITWINEQNEYFENIVLSLEKKIVGRESILYYLVADILDIKSYSNSSGDHFKKAFDAFNKDYTRQCINVGQQHLFTLVLFKCLASLKNKDYIMGICQTQIKEILMKKKLQTLFPIYQHFLSIKEIVQIAEDENNSTNLWKMKLGHEFYAELTRYNLRRSVYRQEMLSYMDDEDCLNHLFRNANLSDVNMGSILIKIMSDYEEQMRDRLKSITKVNVTPVIQRNFNLFLNVWNNYYRLIQANSIESFELVFTTDEKSFDPDFRDIFYCPLSSRDVISDALISFSKGLQERIEQPKSYHDGIVLYRKFCEMWLEKAIALINEEKRMMFQLSWAEMTLMDLPEKEKEVMKALLGQADAKDLTV